MAHFAKLNNDNLVVEVNVVNNEVLDPNNEEASGVGFLTTWSGGYTNWKQTSYNKNFRKEFAGIGYTYDADADVFVRPQPFASWTLDANHDWQPPTPKPVGDCYWDETELKWVTIQLGENNEN